MENNLPLFIPSKDEILVKTTSTSLHEKKTGWRLWALIFCVDVHMELISPPSACVHPNLFPPPPPCGRYKWIPSYRALLPASCRIRIDSILWSVSKPGIRLYTLCNVSGHLCNQWVINDALRHLSLGSIVVCSLWICVMTWSVILLV